MGGFVRMRLTLHPSRLLSGQPPAGSNHEIKNIYSSILGAVPGPDL